MNCHECRAYFDDLMWEKGETGVLPEPVRQHLHACPACAAEWESACLLGEALRSWADESPPPGYVSRFWTRAAAEPSRPRLESVRIGLGVLFRKPRLAIAAGGAAAVLIAMVVGYSSNPLMKTVRPPVSSMRILAEAAGGGPLDGVARQQTAALHDEIDRMRDKPQGGTQEEMMEGVDEEMESLDETLLEMLALPDADWEMLEDLDVLAAWDGQAGRSEDGMEVY